MTAGEVDTARAAELLVKVLAWHDLEISLRRILDACSDFSDAGIVAGLRQCGVDARHVRLGATGLFGLPLSSIVRVEDGSMAMLVSVEPGEARLRDEKGNLIAVRRGPSSLRSEGIAIRKAAPTTGSFVSRLVETVRHEKGLGRAIAVVLGTSAASLGLGVGVAVLTRFALNDAILERASSKLAAIAVGLIAILLHVAWAGWLRQRALLWLETKLAERGVDNLVQHLLGLPLTEFDRLDIGLVTELSGVAHSLATQAMNAAGLVTDTLVAAGALGFLFWLDPASGLVATAGAVMMLLFSFVVARRAQKLRTDAIDAGRSQRQALFETVEGIETVRAEAAEERMLHRWTARMTKLQAIVVREQDMTNLFTVVTSGIDRLAFAAVLLLVASRALRGDAQLGDVVGAIQACAAFFVTAQAASKFPLLAFSIRAQVRRLDELLAIPADRLGVAALSSDVPEVEDALVFSNVAFRYGATLPWAVRDANIKVARGGNIRLTWPSGAGKSTLLRLASGLLSPERGDVLVFGLDAPRARHLVMYIPQDAMLLPLPILENLRLLSRGASLERIARAANATGLADVVSRLPMAFETPVAPGGANLSSGQRQLILFTAAIASTAPLLLLDETFAHMDHDMRRRLVGLDLLQGRTVVTVLHGESDNADGFVRSPTSTRPGTSKLQPVNPGLLETS